MQLEPESGNKGGHQPDPEYPVFNNDPNPQKIMSLYENRLRQFTGGGQYDSLMLNQFFDRDRKSDSNHVKMETYPVPDTRRPHFHDAMNEAEGNWKETSKGQRFGPSWSTHWFKIHIKVPSHWQDADRLIFNWDPGNEGFVYLPDGTAVVGLSHQDRKEWIIPPEWNDGKWHLFYIEMSCNVMTGNGSPPDPNKYFTLNKADLVWPNLEARALNIDFWIIGDAAREFPGDSWQKHKARDVANKIMNAFDVSRPEESIAKCRLIAKEYLGDKIDSAKVYDSDRETRVLAVGNCHIDTAWLWPYAETHRKVGRSWASQLDLIDRYPEYRFVASQMQQFKWLADDYPDVFSRLKDAVKRGTFIPIGGSWVEHDTNMPSGESMVRQFLLGQRFMQHHFGSRTKTFWLPDTFGYSPQIPQFCRGVGIDRFLTQKLSWNNINKFPHNSFNWVALDGSQVLCHMPPSNTYTASAHFGDVNRSLKQHKNLESHQQGLLLFGHGDGGGGPTAEMLEKLRRCRGVSDSADGLLPRVHSGPGIDDFYDDMLKDTNNGRDLVTWVGELYLEFHRGTYTTQASIKRGNRVSEALMHDLEYLATMASIGSSDYTYPTKELTELWEKVCINQFHDVLPGSGIEMIYKDANEIYDFIFEKSRHMIHRALNSLGIHKTPGSGGDREIVSINTLPWARNEIIKLDQQEEKNSTDQYISQMDSNGSTLLRVACDGSGIARPIEYTSSHSTVSAKQVKGGVFVLDNGKIRATIEGGALSSVWDYDNEREVLADGKKGNQLVLLEDTPLSFPAWDTELYSYEKMKNIPDGDVRIVENGPIRAAVEVEQQISDKSSIKTTISLDAVSEPGNEKVKSKPNSCSDEASSLSYIEFTCEVDWHETYQFLKVEFPVDVHSTEASYETSYGMHKRPTHYNTTWDVAKFEVCGHRWADLSDYGYGVTIINDCKYGYSIHGNTMRLSLLRASKSPDANADMGKHVFRYAMLPHKGSVNPNVVRTAYNFNHPMEQYYAPRVLNVEESDILNGFKLIGDDNLILANVKRAEDDEDTSERILPVRNSGKNVILRVYDSLGTRSRGVIESNYFAINKAYKVNHLEDELEELEVFDQNKIKIEQRPFEISSYKLVIQ